MPSYSFKCNDCGEVFDVVCRISDMSNQQCKTCGSASYETHHTGAASIGDSVRLGIRRPDDGFKEVLSKIHERNYKSNLGSKLSRS